MFYGWWIVVLIFLTTTFSGAVIWNGFTAFFSPLVNEFGWSYTAISIAASFRGVETGLLDIAMGFFVDRFGARKIVFFGSLLVGLGFFLLSRISSLTGFYMSFFLIFIGASGFSIVIATWVISQWFRKKLGLAMGITIGGFGAGGIGVPVIVYLLNTMGLRTTFVIIAITTVIVGIIIAIFLRNHPEDMGYQPDGETPSDNANEAAGKPEAEDTPAIANQCCFSEAAHEIPFWIITFASTVGVMSILTVQTHIMPYLESINYSRSAASIFAMMIPLMSIIGRLACGWASAFLSRRLIFVLSLTGFIRGLLLVMNANNYFLLIPSIIIFGISYGGVAVIRPIILRDYYGISHIGSIFGVCQGICGFGGIAGPVLGGWFFDTTHSYGPVWIINCTLCAFAILLMLIMKKPRALISKNS